MFIHNCLKDDKNPLCLLRRVRILFLLQSQICVCAKKQMEFIIFSSHKGFVMSMLTYLWNYILKSFSLTLCKHSGSANIVRHSYSCAVRKNSFPVEMQFLLPSILNFDCRWMSSVIFTGLSGKVLLLFKNVFSLYIVYFNFKFFCCFFNVLGCEKLSIFYHMLIICNHQTVLIVIS